MDKPVERRSRPVMKPALLGNGVATTSNSFLPPSKWKFCRAGDAGGLARPMVTPGIRICPSCAFCRDGWRLRAPEERRAVYCSARTDAVSSSAPAEDGRGVWRWAAALAWLAGRRMAEPVFQARFQTSTVPADGHGHSRRSDRALKQGCTGKERS